MIAQYLILGALATALVQFLKIKFDTQHRWETIIILVGISTLLGVGVQFINHYDLMPQVLAILATANAIYSFVILPFENGVDAKDPSVV